MSKLAFVRSVWWLLIYFYWFQGIIASVWWNFYVIDIEVDETIKKNSNKNLKFTSITVLNAIPFVRFSCRNIIIVWPVSRQQVLYDEEKKTASLRKDEHHEHTHTHTHTLSCEHLNRRSFFCMSSSHCFLYIPWDAPLTPWMWKKIRIQMLLLLDFFMEWKTWVFWSNAIRLGKSGKMKSLNTWETKWQNDKLSICNVYAFFSSLILSLSFPLFLKRIRCHKFMLRVTMLYLASWEAREKKYPNRIQKLRFWVLFIRGKKWSSLQKAALKLSHVLKLQSPKTLARIDLIWNLVWQFCYIFLCCHLANRGILMGLTLLQFCRWYVMIFMHRHFTKPISNCCCQILVVAVLFAFMQKKIHATFELFHIWYSFQFLIFFSILQSERPASASIHSCHSCLGLLVHLNWSNYWKYQCYLFASIFSLMDIFSVFQVFFFVRSVVRSLVHSMEMRKYFTVKWNH